MGERLHWFEDLADHLGEAYLRYSFTKGTEQEAGFLLDALGLRPGMTVLDVGCGPGRHAYTLARRGLKVLGLDASRRFVELATSGAPDGATFVRGDARELEFDAEFDAAIALCQGGFGLGGPSTPSGDPQNLVMDGSVLGGIRRALRPGGQVAISAFSAYFQVRWLEETDRFDAATGINHEVTRIRDGAGAERAADLWTTCFTPRELHLMFQLSGLQPSHIWSVEPGRYRRDPPTIDSREFLVLAHRPA